MPEMSIRVIRVSPIRQQAYQIDGIESCKRLAYELHNY